MRLSCRHKPCRYGCDDIRQTRRQAGFTTDYGADVAFSLFSRRFGCHVYDDEYNPPQDQTRKVHGWNTGYYYRATHHRGIRLLVNKEIKE